MFTPATFPARSTPVIVLVLLAVVSGCFTGGSEVGNSTPGLASSPHVTVFLDSLQVRTFRYFWDQTDSTTGLAPDRYPSQSFASVAATGFALTAYPIGVERGWVSRDAAARRVLSTLRFFWSAPQDSSIDGATGFRGHYYHFLRPDTGTRFGEVELSTVDTALLLAGALFCQSYFDQPIPVEQAIRDVADSLYVRADWQWASVRPPTIGHGWKPETGHLPYDWRGYNEAMLLYILAAGSPSHPVGRDAWDAWVEGYEWGEFQGTEHLGFGPLFGHQYSQIWIDFRGIRDPYMEERGIDYFENSRRAVRAQYEYALDNDMGWVGYGTRLWGLTACDGPVNASFTVDGELREFHTYWARGATSRGIFDDGTVAPTAAAASIAFAPDLVIPTLLAIREDYGDNIYSSYGFLDALNPTFRFDVEVQHGRVDPELGWFDTDYLGIDQGPIVAMIENYRSELIWRTMRKNPHVVRGLRRVGFTGGWLDQADPDR